MTKRATALLLLALTLSSAAPATAATIIIVNGDAAGEGLNDQTPREPVPGNDGTTLGEQRLNALNRVAQILGSRIRSNIAVRVAASFESMSCGSQQADLAGASADTVVRNFRNAGYADTYYPIALANALAGNDLDSGNDINASFSSTLDSTSLLDQGCLGGADWYYGFDGNPPGNDVNFIATATHELIHGLGFATYTNVNTGAFLDGVPDIYAHFVKDLSQNKRWPQLTANQRAASAANDGNVVWSGPSISPDVAQQLARGTNGDQVLLYAPNPVSPGSSISHWDDSVTPNALMEPFAQTDVNPNTGIGLSACVLRDIGWTLINGTTCPDASSTAVAGPSGSASGGSGASSGSSGGGGGCALTDRRAPFDPLLLALAGLAAWRLRRRRA